MTAIVRLDPWEYEWAYRVGIGRCAANWESHDAKHYSRDRMEEDRRASPASALCELAVAKLLNQYWSGSVWYRGHAANKRRPDVGKNIEVRRVRSRPGPTIRRTDLGRLVYGCRITHPEWREVEVLGYYAVPGSIEELEADERLVRYGDHFVCPVQHLSKLTQDECQSA
jgi:hypothetical protein